MYHVPQTRLSYRAQPCLLHSKRTEQTTVKHTVRHWWALLSFGGFNLDFLTDNNLFFFVVCLFMCFISFIFTMAVELAWGHFINIKIAFPLTSNSSGTCIDTVMTPVGLLLCLRKYFRHFIDICNSTHTCTEIAIAPLGPLPRRREHTWCLHRRCSRAYTHTLSQPMRHAHTRTHTRTQTGFQRGAVAFTTLLNNAD